MWPERESDPSLEEAWQPWDQLHGGDLMKSVELLQGCVVCGVASCMPYWHT
jgi:hypothetical protein